MTKSRALAVAQNESTRALRGANLWASITNLWSIAFNELSLLAAGSVPQFGVGNVLGGPREKRMGKRPRDACERGHSTLARQLKRLEQGFRLERRKKDGKTEGVYVQD